MVCKNRFSSSRHFQPTPQAWGSVFFEAQKSYNFLASQI
ncbi:MAG: hypothetical protein ACI9LN_002263, partial [Saprospiraceae bacterium]|jgi:hypothetical protein